MSPLWAPWDGEAQPLEEHVCTHLWKPFLFWSLIVSRKERVKAGRSLHLDLCGAGWVLSLYAPPKTGASRSPGRWAPSAHWRPSCSLSHSAAAALLPIASQMCFSGLQRKLGGKVGQAASDPSCRSTLQHTQPS